MMIDLLSNSKIYALIMNIKAPCFDTQKNRLTFVSVIHRAVPMFVHSYVPMQLRSLPLAGELLGGRIVVERSNGVRSVGNPGIQLFGLDRGHYDF